MAIKRDALIRALLCSATAGHDPDCASCPYVLPQEFGGHTWDGCDCDRMARDAAERLRRDGDEEREKICDVLRGKIAAFRRQRRATEDYSGILMRAMNYRPMSNGDRIRRMSDEELTELLENRRLVCGIDREWCEQRKSCENCTADWIRSPAKEGSKNETR